MMERRTGLMIAYDILTEARGGSLKTRLVYRCNLNFNIIKTWLTRLTSKGLIEYSPEHRTWTTTPNGLDFISAMVDVLSIWGGGHPPEGMEMEAIKNA